MAPKRDAMNTELQEFYEKAGIEKVEHCDSCGILLPVVDLVAITTLSNVLLRQSQAFEAFRQIVVSLMGEQHFTKGEDISQEASVGELFGFFAQFAVGTLKNCGHHMCRACLVETNEAEGCVACRDAPKEETPDEVDEPSSSG